MASTDNKAISPDGADALPPDAPAPNDISPELAAELTALEQAFAFLKERKIGEAEALLAPYEGVSEQAATMMMIARMRMVQGSFDQAHEVLKKAEALHPFDRGVWETLADLMAVQARHAEEIVYRRKLAYTDANPPARAHLAVVRAFVSAAQQGVAVPIGELRLASRKISEASGFTPELEIQFAESLYPVKKMHEEAKAHYAHASPCTTGLKDVSARWVGLAAWCQESEQPIYRIGESEDVKESPCLAELNDVQLYPDFQWIPVVEKGEVALKGFGMSRLRSRREQPSSPLLMQNSRTAELRLPKDIPMIDTPAVLIGSVPQYYHHTVEYVSRLAIVEALGIGTDLPLVVNEDLAPFQLEHLALLGYSPERLIRVAASRPVRFSRLIVPGILVTGGQWMNPLISQWYQKRLGTTVKGGGARRLYLSRNFQDRRRVKNEDELVAMLRSLDFQIVYPEKLGVKEQIELFSGASHIVSSTGAALANLVYVAPGAKVVCLQSRYLAVAGDRYFDALSVACGHEFVTVQADVAGSREGERAFDADIFVDLEALRAAIG